jgi:hypothetical protein
LSRLPVQPTTTSHDRARSSSASRRIACADAPAAQQAERAAVWRPTTVARSHPREHALSSPSRPALSSDAQRFGRTCARSSSAGCRDGRRSGVVADVVGHRY